MHTQRKDRRLTVEEYTEGILAGNRFILSRAITLLESRLPADRAAARLLLEKILPYTGRSLRIGVTGVPGAGKSTFIESFGGRMIDEGRRLAVLAVDPSSRRTGGSIMGDKTRMETLANRPEAYIRPSPSGDAPGGVGRMSRETVLLCEAAGFDLILIETVGVGQSEIAVSGMSDFFLLLLIAGAGDDLQGIKKGVMEFADLILVNKADGENIRRAQGAKAELSAVLHLFPVRSGDLPVRALTCSALEGSGQTEIREEIFARINRRKESGDFDRNRSRQQVEWMYDTLRYELERRFFESKNRINLLAQKESAVASGREHAVNAALDLLNR